MHRGARNRARRPSGKFPRILAASLALLALWSLRTIPGGPAPFLQLLVAMTGLAAGWWVLRRGLEPYLATLRPSEQTLHALVVSAAFLLSLLFLTLHASDRLPDIFLSDNGQPVLFLDAALAGVICQMISGGPGTPADGRYSGSTAQMSRVVYAAYVASLSAVAFIMAAWLSAGSPLQAIQAALAALLVADPLLHERVRDGVLNRMLADLPTDVGRVSPEALPLLGQVGRLLFQRRGILTWGHPEVRKVVVLEEGKTERDIVRLAAASQLGLEHPLREALLCCSDLGEGTVPSIKGFEHIPGMGVRALIQGRELLFGNERLLAEQGWTRASLDELEERCRPLRDHGDTAIILALSGKVLGLIAFRDPVRSGAASVVDRLRRRGLRIGVISDDDPHSVENHCRELGPIEVVPRQVTPDDVRETTLKDMVITTRSDNSTRLRQSTVVIEWPPDRGEPAKEVRDPEPCDPEPPRVTLETADLQVVPRLVDLGRTFHRKVLLRRAGIFLYQVAAWPLVAGALHPLLGWGPSPLLAAFLFLAARKFFGSEARAPANYNNELGVPLPSAPPQEVRHAETT